jgi:heparosan-N-sulfate-glucuronate 5-epimerase
LLRHEIEHSYWIRLSILLPIPDAGAQTPRAVHITSRLGCRAYRRAAEAETVGGLATLDAMRAAVGIRRVFSNSLWFPREVGSHIGADEVRGYYVDLQEAAAQPEWPPPWLRPGTLHVGACQWGLGSYERYVAGQGDEWLTAAAAAGDHLLSTQEQDGQLEGGWAHPKPYPHTYSLRPPWLSGIAQGQAASLLVRLHLATNDERYARGARNAVRPLSLPRQQGGLLAPLGDGQFPEEYPTDPPSFVLNGGIYAFWGDYDVWIGLGDPDARRRFEEGVETLARNVHRWDTGYWSRYDLYPHRIVNVAAPWYHTLHICQLKAFDLIAPRSEFRETLSRFDGYASSPVNTTRAFVHKAVFRVLTPRTRASGSRNAFRRLARLRKSTSG